MQFVEIEQPENIMELHPVTGVKDFSDDLLGKITSTNADLVGTAQLIRINEINAVTADYVNVSRQE